MLILTRKIGESIIIGDNIVVNVLGIRGLQVRLGIEAPRDVSVHREEVYQRILKEREDGVVREDGQDEMIEGDDFETVEHQDDE